jgi:hypothetical protein
MTEPEAPATARHVEGRAAADGGVVLDHVAHFVPDIDAAAMALTQLGFAPTPFSAQHHRTGPDGPLEPAGTGNRCVMLREGYLEFLAATADTGLAQRLRAAMHRYVGVHLMAFGAANPEHVHARLAGEGFAPQPPISLERRVGTPTGEARARFTVIRVPPEAMPEGRIQFVAHHTPELVWQSRWLDQPNRLVGLAEVLVCVADVAECAARFARFTGRTTAANGGTARLALDRGAVRVFSPAGLRAYLGCDPPGLPWIAGYGLTSSDLAATARAFGASGMRLRPVDGDGLAGALPPALGGWIVVRGPGQGS